MPMRCHRHPFWTARVGVDLPYGIVSALWEEPESGENLATLQRGLAAVVDFIILPAEERVARRLALTESQYLVQDDVLYHVEEDGTLRVIPPTDSRERQAHAGSSQVGGHLRDANVHRELRRHYWWPGIRGDVGRWSKGCLVCASHSAGSAVRPPLTPIPVSGPFEWMLSSFHVHQMAISMPSCLWTI